MSVEQFGYKQELHRALTFRDLLVYGMIFMVPIAPFGVFGYVWDGAQGMVALAYLIGMVAMFFTAMSYWSMSRAFPVSGSVYAYAQRGIHPIVGFFAGWLILLDYILVPSLLYIVSAAARAQQLVNHPAVNDPQLMALQALRNDIGAPADATGEWRSLVPALRAGPQCAAFSRPDALVRPGQ